MLKIENLNKIFYTKKGKFLALKDINLEILPNKVTAIVGESGSGKSTLANVILGVLQADSGKLSLQGENLSTKRSLSLKRKIAWVGQNPLSALNPYHTIESSISLPIKVHNLIKDKNKIKTRVSNLLEMVDLPKDFASRYPNSLSGGQRQRVAIARAIALEPEIILLDEPTSALDVLVQAKVLKLLVDLKQKFNMTYIFITHDLGVVRSIADEVVVMKGGEMIEHCDSDIFFKNPTNPYILELLSHIPCVSQQEQDYKEKIVQKGTS